MKCYRCCSWPCECKDGQTIIHGDCRDVLPQLDKVDLVLTDPPYGIGERLVKGGGGGGWAGMVSSKADSWDRKIDFMPLVMSAGRDQIIWGGNFYRMPPCDMPICWDKVRPNQKNVSEWEYAWTSSVGRARMFRFCGNGGFVSDIPRYHPTQKPEPVMRWCLNIFPDAKTVLDPFLGSGTTLRACKDLGRRGIGIEIEEKYCEIAAQRLRQEVLQFS